MKEMIIMKLSKYDSLPQSSQSRTKKIMWNVLVELSVILDIPIQNKIVFFLKLIGTYKSHTANKKSKSEIIEIANETYYLEIISIQCNFGN